MLPRKTILAASLILLAIVLLSIPRPAAAVGVVDQSYIPPTSGWKWIKGNMPIGQSFTPSTSSLLGVDVGLDNVLVTDQSYNPGFGGAGYNYINSHTPIGQSFTPTMPLLGAVDVGILNDFVLDQSFDPGFGVSWNYVQAHQPIGQSFTPVYPQLWRVDLGLENPSAAPVSLTLNIRQGTISGSIVGTQTFNVPVTGPSWRTVYFAPYPGVPLIPGDPYVLDLVGAGADTVRWYIQTSGGSYSGGNAITDGSPAPGGDYLFKTYGFGNQIKMNIHSGGIGGAVIASKTLLILAMDFPIMMKFTLDAPVAVTPGLQYVIELQQSPESVRWYEITPGGSYPGGTAITDGSPDPGGDYLFNTYGAGTNLIVNIRGASIGGPVLGSGSVKVPVMASGLVHVDLPSPVSVTPGSPYVIELQQSDAQSMRWYLVEPGGGYPGGTAITNGAVEASGDYIFQTYAPTGPAPTSLAIGFTPPTVDIGTAPPQTGSITATITPVVPGVPISIYYGPSPAGPWMLIVTGLTDGSGKFTVSWAPPANGTYYFRADFAGNGSYGPSTTTSNPNSMVVVPEFPFVALTLIFATGIFEILRHRTTNARAQKKAQET